ncbi:MAG: ABC transporter ATP-binding protein [Patescibacteria group bacterium]|nr:ABC transporter ATP-binding protein [Patescibacteria group bacterium]
MIKLTNVSKVYQIGGETFTAVNNVSLHINQGEFVSIVGPSGSGKSTLMHMIGLLDHPTSGTIEVHEKDISNLSDNELSTLRNEFVGFVFQQFNLINKLTVLENVLLPTLFARKKLSYDPRQKALDLLDRFGMKDKALSYPNKISGGQQQRVAIARALIMNPDVILADEPTGNLDSKTGEIILSLLQDLHKDEGRTIVVITHDMHVANKAKRTIHIKDGRIV